MEHPWDRRLGVWYIAEDSPDAPAIAESPDGSRTYGQLAGGAHQLVHALRSLGLRPGDAIAAIMPNGIDLIEQSLACQEAGWLFTPLNTSLTASEINGIIEHSGAVLLLVHKRLAHLLQGEDADPSTAVRTLSIGHIDGVQSLDQIRATHPVTPPQDRTTGALFPYSSGTTGKPKGIRRAAGLSQGSDPAKSAHDAAIFGRAFDFRPFDGPHLVSTGMYHGGSHVYYMGALNVGQALVIMGKFDAEESLRLIEEHRIRTAYMVPTQFVRLLRLAPEIRARYDVSSLHSVVHSAAPCPQDVKEQMMAWWGPVIWETYGGMEGAATIAKPLRWLDKPGTVGRPVKGVKLFILDDEGRELPPGEVGQIYMQLPTRFEYHKDLEGTAQAFKGSRHTIGDVGYVDDEGFLYIKDRAKDMIISGGVNIYPAEIEAVLQGHTAVDDVAVIGVPDPEWGESVKAVVVPRAGSQAGPELAGELIAFCRARLSSYKCPRSVDFRESIPRTEAGKLYKRQVRDEYWSAAGRSV